MMNRLEQWARTLKRETGGLYFAARDPRTPWYAKALAAFVVAYALSPIDLIPDFIPVLGYLDDLVLVPAGLWLAVRLIPAEVMDDCRARAARFANRPAGRAAAFVIIVLWVVAAIGTGWLACRSLTGD